MNMAGMSSPCVHSVNLYSLKLDIPVVLIHLLRRVATSLVGIAWAGSVIVAE